MEVETLRTVKSYRKGSGKHSPVRNGTQLYESPVIVFFTCLGRKSRDRETLASVLGFHHGGKSIGCRGREFVIGGKSTVIEFLYVIGILEFRSLALNIHFQHFRIGIEESPVGVGGGEQVFHYAHLFQRVGNGISYSALPFDPKTVAGIIGAECAVKQTLGEPVLSGKRSYICSAVSKRLCRNLHKRGIDISILIDTYDDHVITHLRIHRSFRIIACAVHCIFLYGSGYGQTGALRGGTEVVHIYIPYPIFRRRLEIGGRYGEEEIILVREGIYIETYIIRAAFYQFKQNLGNVFISPFCREGELGIFRSAEVGIR